MTWITDYVTGQPLYVNQTYNHLHYGGWEAQRLITHLLISLLLLLLRLCHFITISTVILIYGILLENVANILPVFRLTGCFWSCDMLMILHVVRVMTSASAALSSSAEIIQNEKQKRLFQMAWKNINSKKTYWKSLSLTFRFTVNILSLQQNQ